MKPITAYYVALREEALEPLKAKGLGDFMENDYFFCKSYTFESSFLVMNIEHKLLDDAPPDNVRLLIPIDFVFCIAGYEDKKPIGFSKQ